MNDRTLCCDICQKKTDHISDYYAMICQSCKHKYMNNMVLLKRIGQLMTRIEDMEAVKNE
jgi:hypothetical protein